MGSRISVYVDDEGPLDRWIRQIAYVGLLRVCYNICSCKRMDLL